MSYYKQIKDLLRKKGPQPAADLARELGLPKGNTIAPLLNQMAARGEVRFSVRRRKKPAVWELVP